MLDSPLPRGRTLVKLTKMLLGYAGMAKRNIHDQVGALGAAYGTQSSRVATAIWTAHLGLAPPKICNVWRRESSRLGFNDRSAPNGTMSVLEGCQRLVSLKGLRVK